MLIGFHMLNQPCIPGVNPTWSWYTLFFKNMLQDLVH